MKIKDFESRVERYKGIKIDNFLDIQQYLTSPLNYAHNFTPYEITEGYIDNDSYYSAYVFNENVIANREVISTFNSGWTTTIIFIESTDRKNIDGYYIHQSNGLTREEIKEFLYKLSLLN